MDQKNSLKVCDSIHLETVDSTQSWAQRNFRSFTPHHLTVISTEEQTEGRGRFQRKWMSPKGQNLYVTFYMQIPSSLPSLAAIGQVLASTIASLLKQKGLNPLLKWPNDLLLSGKKISGILCECTFEKDQCHCFLGMGLNVNMNEELFSHVPQPITSLKVETGKEWPISTLLSELQRDFSRDLEVFIQRGFPPFLSIWNDLLAYKNQRIVYSTGHASIEGTIQAITPEGHLSLLLSDGTSETLMAGELSCLADLSK